MESEWGYGLFRQIVRPNEILSQGIFLCILAYLISLWFRRVKERSKISGLPVPGLKVKRYSPYGNLDYFPSWAGIKASGIPVTSYILLNLQGNGKIFQKEGIFRFWAGFELNVVLTKAEHVEVLLSKSEFLEKGELYGMLHTWLGTGLLTSHGSKWKSRRKLLTPSFHFDILKDFLPIFDDQSRVLVDILKTKSHEPWVDIVHLITLCSLDIICDTTLGVHVGAQADSTSEYVQALLRASQTLMERVLSPILRMEITFRLTPIGRQFKKDINCLHNFTRKVIQQKKDALKLKQDPNYVSQNSRQPDADQPKKTRKALMDLLLDVHMNNKEFTEEDVREEIDTFAFEGHDTTAMGMSWALYLIGLYPEIQKEIHQELDVIFGDDRERTVTLDDLREMTYLERVLKESQRLYPSVPFFARRAHRDFNICDYKIEKESTVVVNTYILHRNSDVFPDPERFDPDRFLPENCANRNPYAYVPFSAGPRNCIGQRFAAMEEKTVVSNILRSFQVRSLDQRDKIFPTSELILRTAHPLRLKFIPRDSQA